MKKYLIISSILGLLTVILGAFGAHALEKILTENQLKSFETAVRYQMYHVLVIIIVNVYTEFSIRTKSIISNLFLSGILFFSGSIYAITFGVNSKNIWFITPIGGFVLIIGWVFLIFFVITLKSKKNDQ
ncbi:DUF423 domain-containing protein [Lutibacter sp.]|uniref:DUF423 domain-containing protein n=1 Tax=Lutibacter sp. TaxID=1925666 RepID=UPI0027346B44|nr:DUF423 domain-containing protein [Lutibacter sp.]MDP3312131.1 DUF423 domain-containing protein [Lutibacter sp.]